MSRLFLLFTVVPAVELYLLIVIGSWIGPASTVGLLLLSGALGAWLVRSQGARVLVELSQGLQRGESPAPRLVEAGLVLLGGLLLLTPGVLTDLLGFALLIPPTRRLLAPLVLSALGEALRRSGARINLGVPQPGGFQTGPQASSPGPQASSPGPQASSPGPQEPRRPPFDHPTF